MILSDIAVKRPVLAIVLSALLCVFGLVSLSKLAVREMPDIDNPVVSIMTQYSGVSATIMEQQVTTVLEDQISGIRGIDEITSTSRNNNSRITVTFEIGYDLQAGMSDIRAAVDRARSALPEQADDPQIFQNDGSGEPLVYVNVHSSGLDRTQLTDYVERILTDRFSLLDGVSSVDVSGGLEKVMYVELRPQAMAGRGVTISDIVNALNRENLESPGGQVRNDSTVMTVRTARNYQSAQDFQFMVVKRSGSNQAVYLKDVANVYIGAKNEDSLFRSDGIVNVSLGIVAQTSANPLQVAKLVRQQVALIKPFLPAGTEIAIDYDSTVFIEQSIKEVNQTLLITALVVIVVLYLFLGQIRVTLIPAVTVPVSLISAAIIAYWAGYSINLITLMAFILAIGLVVDDAIVVVENVYHHIERGESPLLAAFKGTREVGFAVVATTIVLVMVFLPIAFMDGLVGLIFTEFAMMLVAAVICSSFIALTLTPVLGSWWLKPSQTPSRFHQVIDRMIDKLTHLYKKALAVVILRAWFAPLVILACIAGGYQMMQQTPTELTPQEDRGVLFAFVRGADGTSFERMSENMAEVEQRLMPMLGQGVLKSFSIQTPAFGGQASDQTGFVIMILEDWQTRTTSAPEALKMIRQSMSGITDVRFRVFMPGFRGRPSGPIQVSIAGSDYPTLYHWAQQLEQAANQSGLMTGVDIDYSENSPELLVNIDVQRASQLGIAVQDVSQTLEVLLGGASQTTFVEDGQEYDVYLRANEDKFNSLNDLSQIYLRTQQGQAVSLDTIAHIEPVAVANKLTHDEKKKSIVVDANLAAGVDLGQALGFLEQYASEHFPANVSLGYQGESKDFKENQSRMWVTFVLALVVVYLVLAAQFESFINPLVVMLTVPLGLFGGFAGLVIMGQGFNIYSQIGMIMLIGMVTKNGILIVEFANQLRDRGIEFEKAIVDAAARRLRPILMTATTTVAGAVPLLLSTGAGYESRIAVGTVIFFGMSVATLITLFVIPAMYRLLSRHTKSPGFVAKQLDLARQKDTKTRVGHG
ncbi:MULTISPECIES: multidrug efflux RND transporter permease subunit [unclassified Vibrio]|uniref:Multidrug efflux RND transporter permease subunit n=1 Tax=Vibrio sp. HB236076 TaxID=3232307 RepID=A0AB39HBY7_9VIBR|nr:multidrug efflux RND transporter permease subunit [Vibrio sp. HB161653]MDP5253813.1 multidrug efflux RND transporter permease subunit [Vibrio sp. HB161653]